MKTRQQSPLMAAAGALSALFVTQRRSEGVTANCRLCGAQFGCGYAVAGWTVRFLGYLVRHAERHLGAPSDPL